MQKLSVYVHIPFCVKKCFYCDFLSFPADEDGKERYVQALLKEIQTDAPNYAGYEVDTVFIGGGTPSVLSGRQMERLLGGLRSFFCFGSDPEITVEVNPGTVNGEKLKTYRRIGINRLSIGTQSVHDKELALLGRIHRPEDFFKTFREARKAGFSNINVDIMAALPGQSAEDYADTLYRIADLKPEHISAYSLIIEEGTPFHEWYGEQDLPDEEEERLMYEQTEKILGKYGYHRYEISNYAREGRECRHNTAYWKRYDYAGFGIGAASMVGNVRWKNISDIEEYMVILSGKGGSVKEEKQVLNEREQMEEFMFLGLRLTEGVSRAEFENVFGRNIEEIYGKVIGKLSGQGLLEADEHIKLTPYGRDISNYVMAEFIF